MQLVPETAIPLDVRNLYDANENITGGAKHLRYLLNRFDGNIQLVLAAYNAGERKVDRYRQIPPYMETQDYVKDAVALSWLQQEGRWVLSVAIAAPSMRSQADRINQSPVISCNLGTWLRVEIHPKRQGIQRLRRSE